MDFGKSTAKILGMNDAVWQRHANPLSGWSRVLTLPLLTISIWSRVWLEWWALLPIAFVILWIWLNPRLFPEPKSTNNWMSKGVLGERVWLNKNNVPIPAHHKAVALYLNILTGSGVIPFAIGIIQLNVWASALGLAIMMIGKLWFLDRMVWLFQDMKEQNERYKSWLR
ncbi:MAG: DUF6653 family protein [Sneathiella sp.]